MLPVAGVLQFGHDRSEEFYFRRARLIERLAAEGDRHLVLVHYGPDHDAHQEWVYNEADLDEAAVVFARDMEEADPTVHARLLRHFSGRRLWRLYADEDPPRLEPTKISDQ